MELLLLELTWRNSKSIWTCPFSPPPPLGHSHKQLSSAGFARMWRARSKSMLDHILVSFCGPLHLSFISSAEMIFTPTCLQNLGNGFVFTLFTNLCSLLSVSTGSLSRIMKRQSKQELTVWWSCRRNLTLMFLYMENLRWMFNLLFLHLLCYKSTSFWW